MQNFNIGIGILKIKEIKFYRSVSVGDETVLWEKFEEYVFLGRSNVGKSSLINSIFGQKSLAHSSSTPGKTRRANSYLLNSKIIFTDLPGYGFAKLGKSLKEELDSMISWYLEERKDFIKTAFVVIDSKIGPQKTDLEMIEFLKKLEIPYSIILGKVDRLSRNELQKSLEFVKSEIPEIDIILHSNKDKNFGIKLERIL